ncbi:MAG: Rpn family recombination-promoting nuclease/putative transposase, partial [Prevotellaceae bacterium]|nr:Rpn family recombination-promoting nuclease/putative transposase [Prevotellaceae bacterium]
MGTRYINPYTDFGFKNLFGTEKNKGLLLDLLRELIRDRGRITDLQYKPTEHLGLSEFDRKSVFDISCETDRKEKLIVEMQRSPQKYFKDRSV